MQYRLIRSANGCEITDARDLRDDFELVFEEVSAGTATTAPAPVARGPPTGASAYVSTRLPPGYTAPAPGSAVPAAATPADPAADPTDPAAAQPAPELTPEQEEERLAWEYLSTCVTDPALQQDIASWNGKVPEVPGMAAPPQDAIASAVNAFADSPVATVVEVCPGTVVQCISVCPRDSSRIRPPALVLSCACLTSWSF